jgi:alpha-ketoglutarate-dependent taurine dioxygenase
MTTFLSQAPDNNRLPVLYTPSAAGQDLMSALPALAGDLARSLNDVGGVLLRGYDVPSVAAFRAFAEAFGHPLLSYEFASTPRSAVQSGVYTSTEYPAHQHIPLHNEQAYTREWPMKIWFHCVTASPMGGETPIADSRAIYRAMPEAIRTRFASGLIYERNYGEFDVPWQKVFNTEDRAEVEAFCQRARIQCEWKPDGDLRTRQHC